MIRIIQYREKCIGCNACVEAAPMRWRISRKDGKSILVEGKAKKEIYMVLAGDDELKENLQAATHCPVKIIRVEKV